MERRELTPSESHEAPSEAERESLELDLRALVAASMPERARRSEPDFYIAPDWSLLAPPTFAPSTRSSGALRSLAAGAVGGAVLALSLVALAAVPAWRAPRAAPLPARDPETETETETAAEPVTDAETETAAEPVADAEPVTATDAVGLSVTGAPAPRPSRVSRAPARLRTATAAATSPSPPRPTAPSTAAIDPHLGAIVDDALSGASRTTTTRSLPATPPPRELSTRLRALDRAIAMCSPDDAGLLRARIVLDGATGRVRSVSLASDDPDGSPSIACATRLIEPLEVAPFAQDHFAVAFAYRL